MKNLFAGVALAAALVIATGCSDERITPDGEGQGQAAFSLTPSGSVKAFVEAGAQSMSTRAEGQKELPAKYIPAVEDFSLTIFQNGSMTNFYETLRDYNQPLLSGGDYTADFTCGDPAAEGAMASYFEGHAAFKVIARKTISVQVTAALANSAVSLATTKWFNNYYTSADLVLRTESEATKISFKVADGNGPAGAAPSFFAPAGTKLYLSGKAVKTNGVAVTFPETLIGTTEARSWHSVTVDASKSSQLTISINLDDEPTEIIEIEDGELNPEA